MKYKKVKVILLCMAAAGVMAGCGSGGSDTGKTVESGTNSSSSQEKISEDSGKVNQDAETAQKNTQDTNSKDANPKDTNPKDTGDSKAQDTDSKDVKEATAPAWEFTADDLEGNEVTQDILKEKKLTMVNYWATFCGPCLREMPELGELNEEYADKGFQIVGVITDAYRNEKGDHNIDVAQEVVDATKASYVHLPVTTELLSGPISSVQAVPTTIFVDENGNQVGDTQVGAKSKEDWAKLIDAYLELV